MLEFRVGPGWSTPPKGWDLGDAAPAPGDTSEKEKKETRLTPAALALQNLISLSYLTVFVECDPSDPIFKGFRISENFYTGFCCRLLSRIFELVPLEGKKVGVDIGMNPGVRVEGRLVQGLVGVLRKYQERVKWVKLPPEGEGEGSKGSKGQVSEVREEGSERMERVNDMSLALDLSAEVNA